MLLSLLCLGLKLILNLGIAMKANVPSNDTRYIP